MIWRVGAVLWLLIEAGLSHMPGDHSREESTFLANWTHLPERFLRSAAHVIMFFILSILSSLGFSWWGSCFCIIWAAVDEMTKKGIKGRHGSIKDVVLNLSGVVAGMLLLFLCIK